MYEALMATLEDLAREVVPPDRFVCDMVDGPREVVYEPFDDGPPDITSVKMTGVRYLIYFRDKTLRNLCPQHRRYYTNWIVFEVDGRVENGLVVLARARLDFEHCVRQLNQELSEKEG
jgi:hypothetical protein